MSTMSSTITTNIAVSPPGSRRTLRIGFHVRAGYAGAGFLSLFRRFLCAVDCFFCWFLRCVFLSPAVFPVYRLAGAYMLVFGPGPATCREPGIRVAACGVCPAPAGALRVSARGAAARAAVRAPKNGRGGVIIRLRELHAVWAGAEAAGRCAC